MFSTCLLRSAGRWVGFGESSDGESDEGPGFSEETGLTFGCILCCFASSESLLRLGDWSPRGAAVFDGCLDVNGFSRSDPHTPSPEGAVTALTGDFGVREMARGRPGATLGLMEKRFRLWTDAEELAPSPFWSLPSLNKYLKS